MNKYDIMFLEDQIELLGSLFIQEDYQEMLPVVNDTITILHQIKGYLMKENRG
jgi:hypothetical protein